MTKKAEFAAGDHVVYPTHGVGLITGLEQQEVGDLKFECYVIEFPHEKMVLRVPLAKAAGSGMRKISTRDVMDKALKTLKGKSRVKRTMWSRRAQEYEAKINSGDPVSIAEVVRDLHRNVGQPEQSYSERQLYEQALGRLAREVAVLDETDEAKASEGLEEMMRAAA